MKVLDHLLQVWDPRNVIACYTVFLVVRAVETDDSQPQEMLLLSEFCPEHMNCDLALGPATNTFADLDFLEEDRSQVWVKDDILQDLSISYFEAEEVKEEGLEWWGKVFVPKPTPHSQCQQQVDLYLRGIRHFEPWALQMWDATAKPTAGLLGGNSNQLGDYDGCLGVESAALGAVQGRYCLADVDLEASIAAAPGVRATVLKLQAGAFVRSKHSDPGHFAPRWSTLHWALCVPAACNHSEVQDGLRQLLQGYQLPGVTVDAVVKPSMCYTLQRDQTLPLPTLISLGFFGGILMLAVVATMVDNISSYPHPEALKTRDRALLAFSLRRTWVSLVSHSEDELSVVHGVRSVCTVMLFAAHKLMPLSLTPYFNRGLLTQYSHSVFSAILRASSVFTDSFLQLSGVLTAYNMGREMSRQGFIPWRQRILARYIRLTPALFAVVLFYAHVFEHLGAGPQWASSITANADLCKQHLWRNILYVQNFFLFEEMCAPHTHQLALDMQLFLIAPAVVCCLHRWPGVSVCLLGVSQLLVIVLRYFTFLHHQLSDFIYHNISITDLYRTANLSYSQAVHRSIPYTIGLVTGFFLQRVPKIHLTFVQIVAGWSLCALLATVTVFYPSHLARPDALYDVGEGALYAALSPLTWATALSWLIIACTTGHGGWLHKALCSHWLVILSRLSYTIYLTQFIVFFYYVGSVRSSQEFSLLYVVGVYEVAGVLVISLLVTLLFDLPMQEIKSILLPSRKKGCQS